MKPQRIILIRHGQSEGNENPEINSCKPDYTLELTDEGLKQAYDAGKKIKSIVRDETLFFYVSPYWRTRSTFEQIVRHFPRGQYDFTEEPRLREQEWGHLRLESDTEVIRNERDSFGPFYFRFPDGESGADVYDRMSDFFGTLNRDFTMNDFSDNAVIVTHGMAIRLFLMRWFHWSVEKFESYANPDNCQLVIMERDDKGRYNLISELKPHEVKHEYQRPIKLPDR
jgi:broad specificity phosphatase PhoE